MSYALPDSAPGFDQPIAVLKHCHDRIRKQVATLEKLLPHLASHGADDEARQAARAVMKYFDQAAPLHHEDEEQNLVPMLLASASGADAELLAQLVPAILDEHRQMDGMWQELHEQLSAIADGSAAVLRAHDVQRFAETYRAHMEREESHIAPMAKRLFSAAQMASLGQAMQQRRGIVPAAAVAAPAGATGDAVASLRKDYGQASLNEGDVAHDPFVQFTTWFEEALKAQVNEPNAMSVATVDEQGRPTSRIVLIKQFDARGFTWYTNYDSQKGRQLAANPHAALLFFWTELERQIRIEGRVERTSAQESDKYFHSRPLKSRLAAIASAQSEPITNRGALEQHYEEVAKQYGEEPPRPGNWGGFRLVPERIEFWQGRRSRFHDRIVYTLQSDGSWARGRLQP
ncbi:pyridoxamine 5'-phosphate oxidase [Massilia antarctica]|uniref:pyridoxamine 5'-phosphate oxidase n=1 Tax=Massilia antarctica TaxID=2765360 RepID=UPI0006BB8608|nr:pyridoxamine 5'-phosphate oxidase [Massilia sp. H27-R4]MCY0913375.1 pyridoxamine 5'-phosphate oxidase [Massilia sp. H27-R4]CUI09506.1 Pyridoxamine 5'-phosphate oxidase [Janthinobacterium sp. CG23_2]CUU33292.1 Pyridoxamine 5'-phosphate oxidase [Janthinobacterium sp. CG23_2]